MEWSNDLTLEFIQLYESYPVLWDPKNKHHRNRNSLYDAWTNIANKISANVTVDVLRKKKESLMSTYRNLAKKVRDSHSTGSGSKDVYEPTWFAYESIDRFIRATTKKNPSLSSEETHNEEFSEDEEVMNNKENVEKGNSEHSAHEESENRNSLESGNGSPGTTNFVLPQGAPKKRGRGSLSQVDLNVTKHLQRANDVLTSLANNSKKRNTEALQDAPALYGQLLAAKLRRLSHRTQLTVQNKIDNIVFEAELCEMNSLGSINTPSVITSNNYYSSTVSTPSPENIEVSPSPTCVFSPESSQDAGGSVLTYYTNVTDILNLTSSNNKQN